MCLALYSENVSALKFPKLRRLAQGKFIVCLMVYCTSGIVLITRNFLSPCGKELKTVWWVDCLKLSERYWWECKFFICRHSQHQGSAFFQTRNSWQRTKDGGLLHTVHVSLRKHFFNDSMASLGFELKSEQKRLTSTIR